jgi:hypothetical protein
MNYAPILKKKYQSQPAFQMKYPTTTKSIKQPKPRISPRPRRPSFFKKQDEVII